MHHDEEPGGMFCETLGPTLRLPRSNHNLNDSSNKQMISEGIFPDIDI